jgi:acyl-[acyl-carrier-protein]-phospholipid O-acyltransferase/long-chain-fatty-acid--[acyl-carrier-protein] ligase
MAAGTYRVTLAYRGVQPFLWTQFLGAFNDNVFKIIVSLIAIETIGPLAGAARVGAVFVLPFLLFSGYAGHLADKYSKRSVLIVTKSLEIVAMALAVPALMLGRLDLLLVVLFLMATHSTFFGPAKYGIVPEILPDTEISRANGLLEMSTFAAIVLGTGFGGAIYQAWSAEPWKLGVVLVAIAVIGTITSFGIAPVGAARPDQRFSINPWGEIGRGIARLWPDRTLWMTAVGLTFFWFLGALLQMALIPFGREVIGVDDANATRLYTPLAVGIAAGSLLAGRLSGDKVELGLVPIGAFGLGVFSLAFAGSTTYVGTAITLAALGIAGGFFAVPLNALIQQRPAESEKGRVLATANFMATVGILLASVTLAASDWVSLTTPQLLVGVGAFTLLSSVYVLLRLPDFFVRFTLWMLTHTIYRITIVGRPNIPQRGPALIIANHVSVVDGALVGACVQRFVRFMVYGPYFRMKGVNWLLRRLHAIPVSGGNRAEVVAAIKTARAELAAGHVVCIFVEGAISRTGNLLPVKRGFEHIVEGLDVPIVPVYLDRVWGSVFSFKRGRFFWKLPEQLPYPVTVAFGDPLPSTTTANEARLAIMELGTEAIMRRRHASDQLHTSFIRSAKRRWHTLALADSTGQELTYGRALVASRLFARAIAARTPGEERVGLLLPASVGGALANIATLMAGRVPINLNFTIGAEAMDGAIAQAGIKTILTSKKFLAKASLPERPGMVFLEDLRESIGGAAKLMALLEARLLPTAWLERRYRGRRQDINALATIIFSSGSTGIPKGVMITHANILANVDGLTQIFPMTSDDPFIGVLPFFHSFGLTGTFWFPLLQGCPVVFHPNPMDAKTVGDLAEKYKASMLISTPTFCQSYLRRVPPEQFKTLKYAIVGAEKLREPLAQAFRERYGIDLLEGYGCTEMAPVVSVNRPDVDHQREHQIGRKFGSVGHPIPGVSAMVVDRDTGHGPLFDTEGLLLVKGPNMMVGYLDQPQRTAEVIRDGWYVTGDIARIDGDGFIFITDRLSRFSKIGGEMVPHIKVEEAINEILGDSLSAVTAIPDESRGERLIAFYVKPEVSPEELSSRLTDTDLPRLWIPRRDNLVPIDAIPTLGTGKVDLRGLKELAKRRFTGDDTLRQVTTGHGG